MKRKIKIRDLFLGTPTQDCDPQFARAIVRFKQAAYEKENWSYAASQNSIFPLLSKYLDEPFEEMLARHNVEFPFKPSKINKPGCLPSSTLDKYLLLDFHQQIEHCLDSWTDYLKDFARLEDHGTVYESIERWPPSVGQ